MAISIPYKLGELPASCIYSYTAYCNLNFKINKFKYSRYNITQIFYVRLQFFKPK